MDSYRRLITSWLAQLLALMPPLLLAVAAGTAHAQFATLETERLRLIYQDPTLTFLAPHTARCFENSLGRYRTLFDYTSDEKITVILTEKIVITHLLLPLYGPELQLKTWYGAGNMNGESGGAL